MKNSIDSKSESGRFPAAPLGAALERCRRAVAIVALLAVGCLAPSPERAGFDAARRAQDDGDYERAIDTYSRALHATREGDPPEFVAETLLERGRCHSALAAPVRRGAALEERTRRLIWDAREDFDAAARALPQAHALRLESLRASGDASELLGDTAAAELSFTALAEEAAGEEPARYANARLGWIIVERLTDGSTELLPSAHVQHAARDALTRFDLAATELPDRSTLLGRGICLSKLELYEESRAALQTALALSDAVGEPNPRAHLYIAIAIQQLQGFRKEAFGHLLTALDVEKERQLFELYTHVVKNVTRYLPPGSPEFHDLARRLLGYRGDEPAYWTEVESLFEQLLAHNDVPWSLTMRGLLLARARTGRIEQAVEDLLKLRGEDDFQELIDGAFPEQSRSPAVLFGRLRVLHATRRHEEVEELLQDAPKIDPTSEYYYRIRGIAAQNLYSRWRLLIEREPHLEGNASIREYYLVTARRMLSQYLHRFPEDVEARTCLAEVLLRVGDASTALSHLSQSARIDPRDLRTFSDLVEMHASRTLSPPDALRAWSSLLEYAGDDPTIKRYVADTLAEHRRRAALYCEACGLRARADEVVCGLCGKRLTGGEPEGAPDGTTEGSGSEEGGERSEEAPGEGQKK